MAYFWISWILGRDLQRNRLSQFPQNRGLGRSQQENSAMGLVSRSWQLLQTSDSSVSIFLHFKCTNLIFSYDPEGKTHRRLEIMEKLQDQLLEASKKRQEERKKAALA